MHKVKVTFYAPPSLTLELTNEEYAAAMDENSWENFYSLMEIELIDHLFAETPIDDIRDVDG
jgi:hypothetical protein